MAIKLTTLRNATRRVSFVYAGEDVDVVYKPGLMTSARRLRIVLGTQAYWESDTTPKAKEMLAGWESFHADLAEMLVSWDVLGEDGKPLAPTADLLEQFPQSFISALVEALIDDQRVDPPTGKDSGATSKPKG